MRFEGLFFCIIPQNSFCKILIFSVKKNNLKFFQKKCCAKEKMVYFCIRNRQKWGLQSSLKAMSQ